MSKTRKPLQGRTYRFVLHVDDPSLTDKQVLARIEKATRDATRACQREIPGLRSKTEVPGGFGGVGEAAVILYLVHALKAGAAAAGLAASGAAGKMFFEKFLAPRLRKLSLLPSKFAATRSGTRPGKPRAGKGSRKAR